jgi:hypothetical protein
VDAIAEFARAHGLELEAEPTVRELTPALITGDDGEVSELARGTLAPGLDGSLLYLVFAEGETRRESTIVLTEAPETLAYLPAMVCRDRGELGDGNPVQLPTERWQPVELESVDFARRYRLLVLAGQDPGYVRELFSPRLLDWLVREAPAGLTFELNEGHLVVAVGERIDRPAELERFCAAAAELARRVRAEAAEEGADPDLFDESTEMAAVDRAVALIRWQKPPASVGTAIAAYTALAEKRGGVLLSAVLAAAVAALVCGGLVTLVWEPLAGVIVAATAAVGVFRIARTLFAMRYRFGGVAIDRAGLDAFVREYARSRSLALEDRWRFHSEHRELPLPGFADHVLAAPRPDGADGPGRLYAMLGDAAEMRTEGREIAYVADRPLAADAMVAELGIAPSADRVEALELPDGYRVESAGAQVAVWRPVQGNLLRTARVCDEFRAKADAALDALTAG